MCRRQHRGVCRGCVSLEWAADSAGDKLQGFSSQEELQLQWSVSNLCSHRQPDVYINYIKMIPFIFFPSSVIYVLHILLHLTSEKKSLKQYILPLCVWMHDQDHESDNDELETCPVTYNNVGLFRCFWERMKNNINK